MAWTEITRRSIDVTSCAMQATRELGNGRRSRRCCRHRAGSGVRASAICARSSTRSFICWRRLSVARLAQGLPATLDGAGVFLPLARRRHLASDQCPAGGARPSNAGAPAAPSAGIIDSQSAPTAKAAARAASTLASASRDASVISSRYARLPARRAGARGQHPGPARRCAALALATPCLPRLHHIFADRVYRGEQLRNAIADCGLDHRIASARRRQGFQLLPRRWVVERTFAWLGRSRRLAKDFEATIASATAWLLLANLRLLSRRLARA